MNQIQAQELEEFCFKFSLNHMTAVTQTEAFAKLDEGTVKDFITKVLFSDFSIHFTLNFSSGSTKWSF